MKYTYDWQIVDITVIKTSIIYLMMSMFRSTAELNGCVNYLLGCITFIYRLLKLVVSRYTTSFLNSSAQSVYDSQ